MSSNNYALHLRSADGTAKAKEGKSSAEPNQIVLNTFYRSDRLCRASTLSVIGLTYVDSKRYVNRMIQPKFKLMVAFLL